MDDLLTIQEAAQRYNVSRGRLQRAAQEKRLPAVKLRDGKTFPWLVRAADVERFLRESRPGRKPRPRP